jgi:hypothetical protein
MASSSKGNLKDAKDKLDKRLPSSELANLPPGQYAIIKKLIAQEPNEMAYVDLCTHLKTDGFSQGDIDLALHQLVQNGYLSSFFDNGIFKYMATLDGNGQPSSRDHERMWDNFQFGLDQLDIDLDL